MRNVSRLSILCEENPPPDITFVEPFEAKKKKKKKLRWKKKKED